MNSMLYVLTHFMYMGAFLHACLCNTCMTGAHGGQKALDHLRLNLQSVVSVIWVLRIVPESSARETSVVNH